MYPTRLYLFWNTIPSLKIPSNCGCNITEYNAYNWTRQNRPNANLTFKNLQNAQNALNTFSTFCWCYYNVFAKVLTCGFWLLPADLISRKRPTSLHTDTMCYDGKSVACHIGEIRALEVRGLMLAPPVHDIRDLKCTEKLQWVGAVNIMVVMNMPPALW